MMNPEKLWVIYLLLLAAVSSQSHAASSILTSKLPRVLSKEVFLRPENGRPVATGFITYISKDKPILMHCFGRQDYSDGYDDYATQVSLDNGRTWSKPDIRW